MDNGKIIDLSQFKKKGKELEVTQAEINKAFYDVITGHESWLNYHDGVLIRIGVEVDAIRKILMDKGIINEQEIEEAKEFVIDEYEKARQEYEKQKEGNKDGEDV
jgi:alkyl hydroperoxide reductase subunit AhpC